MTRGLWLWGFTRVLLPRRSRCTRGGDGTRGRGRGAALFRTDEGSLASTTGSGRLEGCIDCAAEQAFLVGRGCDHSMIRRAGWPVFEAQIRPFGQEEPRVY